MEILQSIVLDFARDTVPITVFAKQYDQHTRYVSITPLNNGASYTIGTGVTARLQMTKPDGTTVINNAQIINNVIKAELTAQALAAAGVAVAEIGLYKNDELLSSQLFYINVVKAAYDEDAVESSDEYGALITATNAANEAATAANNAATAANNAATAATAAKNNADSAASAANTAAEQASAAALSANNAATAARHAASEAGSATTTAYTAAGQANAAATAANTAAEGAGNVDISAEQTATGATITVTDRSGEETEVHIDTLTAIYSWSDIRNAVRLGLGAKLFPPGYEFEVVCPNRSFTIPFVVRGHDTILAKNNKLTHAMILEHKYVYGHNGAAYSGVQFDAPEALCYVENGLSAGTYHFNWNDSNGLSVGDYQFTLASGIPPRGQITINTSAQTVTTYASVGATTAIESNVQLSQGTDGTDLGTTGSGNLNHVHRILWGNNNYAQSAARQLINSAEAAGDVWAPVSKFDRPPSWATSLEGFAHALDPEFLAVVETAAIPCRTSNVFEAASLDGTQFTTASTYTLYDKFFLLSRPEIFGDWDSASIKDGVQLEYYVGLSNAERIRRDKNGSARSCYLRSPYPGDASYVRSLSTGGRLNNDDAYVSNGVAPACIIA
jgi:hypothetical protein